MKLILILFILFPSFLFGQEYHIRPCDPSYYKDRTIKYRLQDTLVKFKVCVDRLWHPDGTYYFYQDSTSKYPNSYETYKNRKRTYKKRIGKRKVEVYWGVGNLSYYDNGVLKDVEGRDTSAGYSTGNLKNFYFYYDSLGNLVFEIRNSFVGIDEHGQYVYKSMTLWRNGSGDTISFSSGIGLDHNSSEYNNKSNTVKFEYDSIFKKKW